MDFDFNTIPQALDTIESVPERFQQFYDKGEDGKFKLTELAPLRNALQRTKEEAHAAKEALATERTRSESRITDLQAKVDAKTATRADKDEIEAIKKQMNDAHAAETMTLKEEISRQKTVYSSTLISAEAEKAIAKANGVPELLMHSITSQLRTVEVDGKLVVRVVQDDGKTTKVKANGDPMTPADLVAEFKNHETFSLAFRGDGKAGSGAQSQHNGGAGQKTMKRADFEALSPSDRSARMKSGFTLTD